MEAKNAVIQTRKDSPAVPEMMEYSVCQIFLLIKTFSQNYQLLFFKVFNFGSAEKAIEIILFKLNKDSWKLHSFLINPTKLPRSCWTENFYKGSFKRENKSLSNKQIEHAILFNFVNMFLPVI